LEGTLFLPLEIMAQQKVKGDALKRIFFPFLFFIIPVLSSNLQAKHIFLRMSLGLVSGGLLMIPFLTS